MQKKTERLKCIEGIRGMAALIVLLHHFAVMFYPAFYWGGEERTHCNGLDIWFGQIPLSFLINGNSGVMFFLLLVGFGTYVLCEKGPSACVKYLILRYVKLVTLAFISAWIVWWIFRCDLAFFQDIVGELNTPWFDNWNPKENSLFFLLRENPIVSLQKYNNTLWTMKYIFVSSFIGVCIYFVGNKCNNRYLIYVFGVLVFMNMGETYYVPCIVGTFLADLYIHSSKKKMNNLKGVMLSGVGVFLCAYPTWGQPNVGCYVVLPPEHCLYYHIIGAACLVYVALFWPSCSRLMETGVMQFLGKYSMMIYMVHYGILISFSAWLYKTLRMYMGYNLTAVYNLIATVLLVIIMAFCGQRVIGMLFKHFDEIYDIIFRVDVDKEG